MNGHLATMIYFGFCFGVLYIVYWIWFHFIEPFNDDSKYIDAKIEILFKKLLTDSKKRDYINLENDDEIN